MKILVFPKDSNPYQSLLYKAMPGSVSIRYLDARQFKVVEAVLYLPLIVCKLFWARFTCNLLHIHWLYPFRIPSRVPGSNKLGYLHTKTFLTFATIFRYKIVWTVHNVLPHDTITSNDLAIRKSLASISRAKIVHGKSVVKELNTAGINTDDCHVIPIGSYKPMYPDTISRPAARKKLGIRPDEFVCLFIGRIEPYKNIPELINSFRTLSSGSKNTRLIVAGKVSNPALTQLMKDAEREFKGRLVVPGFVKDEDVQIYMRAADIALYPFSNVTTSSAVVLALSFGVPVVAPRLGALQDLPSNVGYFYQPGEPDGLLKNITSAQQHYKTRQTKAVNAAQYAATLSWDKIARQTQKVYEEVLQRS